MQPEAATPISLVADQAKGSSMALKMVASLKRVSKHLTGAVDLAATFGTAMFAAGKAAVDAMHKHLSQAADDMSKLFSGEGLDEGLALEGAD